MGARIHSSGLPHGRLSSPSEGRLSHRPRRSLLVLGQELGVLAAPGSSGAGPCAFEQRLAPGQRVVWNVHRAHTELNWVVEGQLLFQVGERVGQAGPGEAVVVPMGCWHTLQGGPAGARLILGFSPADIFGMFEELAQRAASEAAIRSGVAPQILARYRSQARWLLQPELHRARSAI
jgi:hypothetical protein